MPHTQSVAVNWQMWVKVYRNLPQTIGVTALWSHNRCSRATPWVRTGSGRGTKRWPKAILELATTTTKATEVPTFQWTRRDTWQGSGDGTTLCSGTVAIFAWSILTPGCGCCCCCGCGCRRCCATSSWRGLETEQINHKYPKRVVHSLRTVWQSNWVSGSRRRRRRQQSRRRWRCRRLRCRRRLVVPISICLWSCCCGGVAEAESHTA